MLVSACMLQLEPLATEILRLTFYHALDYSNVGLILCGIEGISIFDPSHNAVCIFHVCKKLSLLFSETPSLCRTEIKGFSCFPTIPELIAYHSESTSQTLKEAFTHTGLSGSNRFELCLVI